MRVVESKQMMLGEVDVSNIEISKRSRDDIPTILRGLQHLYNDNALRAAVFALLSTRIAAKVDKDNGRPGMTLWAIFVCGVIRLDLNADYDRLQELINQHLTLRQMLGHGMLDRAHYALQTLKDNVSLLTPELLDQINQLVIPAGHALLKKKGNEALRGRCDSFVVETDVHYPTDINLLFDAMRKVITLTARWSDAFGLSDWRQSKYNLRCVKRFMRVAQSKKRRHSDDPKQQQKNAALVMSAHQDYLDLAQIYLQKSKETLAQLMTLDATMIGAVRKTEIEGFISHAHRQIDQIKRRVIDGQSITHAEKVFSIFEPHTEWVSKGKAGVPQELGLRVCVLEDQHRFILHHQVMEKVTDEQVTVSMVLETKARFPALDACSFDQGFHTPQNQIDLQAQLRLVALPRKGKLSQQARAHQQTPEFIQARKSHAAVESAINALEVHGLDRCLDQGIDGFKRYVALAIVARNIHRIGAILMKNDRDQLERAARKSERNTQYKQAA